MNKIFSTLAIVASAAMLTGCDDYDDRYVPEYASVVRLETFGEKPVTVWSTNTKDTFDVKILRSGHDINQSANATLRKMTNDEWTNYANTYGVQRYYVLPDNCYKFNDAPEATSVVLPFTSGQIADSTVITFYSDALGAYSKTLPPPAHEGEEWANVIVLPLILETDNGSVFGEQKYLLLQPTYKSPQLNMSPAGFEKVSCTASATPYVRNITLSLPGENPWGFTVKVKNDQTLLDKYNAENGTEYTLMQPGALEMNLGDKWEDWADQTIDFPKGTTSASFRVRINPSKAGMMDAMALNLTDASIALNLPEATSSNIFAIAVKPSGVRLSIKAADVTASNYDGENAVANLVSTSRTTIYRSQNTPHDGDPVYGSYVDFKLPKAIQWFALDFTSATKLFDNGACVPSEVHVYVSTDGATWEKCGEITGMHKDITAMGQLKTYGNFDAKKQITYLRWAVVKGGVNGSQDLREKNTSAYWSANNLSIYGK